MTELMSTWARPIHREGTSGEAVVMLHGFTGHPGHFLPMAEELAAHRHTVVAPRLPGHGTTPEDLATTDADDWLGSARAAADSVADHRRIHLVGLSMGGLLSILLARPTAAATITTINSPVVISDPKVPFASLAKHFIDYAPADHVPVPDPTLAHLWTPYDVHPVASVAELVTLVRRAWFAAARLRRPSLVIQSRTDEVVVPLSGPALARRLGARLEWLERTRHNALLDPVRDRIHELVLEMVES